MARANPPLNLSTTTIGTATTGAGDRMLILRLDPHLKLPNIGAGWPVDVTLHPPATNHPTVDNPVQNP